MLVACGNTDFGELMSLKIESLGGSWKVFIFPPPPPSTLLLLCTRPSFSAFKHGSVASGQSDGVDEGCGSVCVYVCVCVCVCVFVFVLGMGGDKMSVSLCLCKRSGL